MIESRYSIEYIDPNPESTSSKLGRVLIYSALTISLIAATVALIFSNLPDSTSQLVTEKVQAFVSSLNDSSVNPSIEVTDEEATNEEITNTQPLAVEAEEENTPVVDDTKLAQQALIATQLESEYKKQIERLSQENTTQHNETVKQLKTNQTLSKKIELLSKQLKDEKAKASLLGKEVATLNTKNQSISALLKETNNISKNYANELKNLKQAGVKTIEIATPIIIPKESAPTLEIVKEAEKKTKKEPIEIKIEEKTTVKITKDEIIKNTESKNQETPEVSQMDAIVAAMEAANNASNTQNTKTNAISEKK